jgi:hypothetical protein
LTHVQIGKGRGARTFTLEDMIGPEGSYFKPILVSPYGTLPVQVSIIERSGDTVATSGTWNIVLAPRHDYWVNAVIAPANPDSSAATWCKWGFRGFPIRVKGGVAADSLFVLVLGIERGFILC